MIICCIKGEYCYLELFDSCDWGFIIYDEVYLLLVLVFWMIVDLQFKWWLGLIVMLICEDGCEGDVFFFIGLKCYDVLWKDIEVQGWIVLVECVEVWVMMIDSEWMMYVIVEFEECYWICLMVYIKIVVVKLILVKYLDEQILVIGVYLDQFDELGVEFGVLVIQGLIRISECEVLFDVFCCGEVVMFVVFKVVNFFIDLLEVVVVVQVLGIFGLCQEEV